MSFWVLLQVLFNLMFICIGVIVWIRQTRPAKDDPRLSKGLQLLQSKIAILEDLSDRTERQFQQMTSLIEQKMRDLQGEMEDADAKLQEIDQSMKKSLEVAKIFQDKIPHQEIIERQNSLKYVQAAQLAHQGLSVDEIAKTVGLGIGEVEFIVKINQPSVEPEVTQEEYFRASKVASNSGAPKVAESLSDLGNQFRQAVSSTELNTVQAKPTQSQKPSPKIIVKPARDEVRKVVFPRIEMKA